MSRLEKALSAVVRQATSEAVRFKASIRIRGKYFHKFYNDPDDQKHEWIAFDVQVTPDGVVHGPNIREIK